MCPRLEVAGCCIGHEAALSQHTMQRISMMADIAVRCGDVQQDVLVGDTLRRLSVVMCKDNANILRVCMQEPTRGVGGAVWYGITRPVADVRVHLCTCYS